MARSRLKTCTTCGCTKALEAFSVSNRGQHHTQCKVCRSRQARDDYEKNPTRYKDHANDRMRRLRERVDGLKRGPCADCGGSFDPVCMDFDHLPGREKILNVGRMVTRRFAWDKIQAEIDKCELVCANCHRLRTKRRLEEFSNDTSS